MLRMCLLSSLGKANKQFGGQKPSTVFQYVTRKSAIASYGISYESNRSCPMGRQLLVRASETVPEIWETVPNLYRYVKRD
jgi:hypothetical protein